MEKEEKKRVADIQRATDKAEKTADEINICVATLSKIAVNYTKGVMKNRTDVRRIMSDEELAIFLTLATDPTDIFSVVHTITTTPGVSADTISYVTSSEFRYLMKGIADAQRMIDACTKMVNGDASHIFENHLSDIVKSGYYREIYELHLRAGVAFPFQKISNEYIRRLTSQDWLGNNYVNRLFKNTKLLADTLKKEIIKGAIIGATEWEITNALALKTAMAKNRIRRLVRTETVYYYTQADMKAREACGIKKYMFLATLDKRTSAICRSLDGKIFYVEKERPGYNCPPMHPWCRSTTLSIINTEWIKTQKRSALDPATGKKVKVPLTMKYVDWYRKYVLEGANDAATGN